MECFGVSYAKAGRDLLTMKAKLSMIDFYKYEPTTYIRSYDLKNKSIKPYYYNHTKRIIGGVLITSEDIRDYQSDTAFDVATYAWNGGYHGHPAVHKKYGVPREPIAPTQILINYRDSEGFVNMCADRAYNEAKKLKYKHLKLQ